MRATRHLRLFETFRPLTLRTIIGLLASTGLRIGEVLRLKIEDAKLTANPPYVLIYETKFGKSRNVVLHPTTAHRLRRYLVKRGEVLGNRFAETFFTNISGKPLGYASTRSTFRKREEMDAILAVLDRKQWCGRRDYALLLTMYNTGARVSEMSFLHQNQVRFGTKSYVQLHGKGRKERLIPLWPRTARILKEWFREIGPRDSAVAFPNVRGEPLSRFAVHLLLRKAAHRAAFHSVSLKRKRVSPHVVRHGTAMALLQSGVDIAVIALWLGHESIETTNAYVHADLAMKERALGKVLPMDTPFRRFHADDRLLAFLESI